MKRIEWALFGLFCLIVLSLQVLLYRHAGSFWRDETSTIQVAGSPSFASMWASLSWDSFPGLFVSLLRIWILAGPGATDAGIRLFGSLIALGGVASVLVSFREMTRSVPLVALSLIAMNDTIFYFGSSIRAYGLAVLLIVPCFAAFWKVSQSPTRLNILAASVLALLTVHCSYQNCFLLFGIGIAGVGVCVLCRLWRRSLLILAICFTAALSMLVYLPAIRNYRVLALIPTMASDWSSIFRSLAQSLAGTSTSLLVVWAVVLSSALILLPYRHHEERRSQPSSPTPSLSLFSLIAIVVGAVSELIFFRANMMTPRIWQFAPLIALAAVVVEIGLGFSTSTAWRSAGKAALACVIVGVSVIPAWHASQRRRTNLDLVSDALAREAGPDDLIIVTSFWLSPGFNYLYRGKAEWNVLPMIPSDRGSRIAFGAHIKKILATDRVIEPTLEKIGKTLRTGHRVWYVVVPNNNAPWLTQFGQFLRDHATQGRQISIPVEQPVSDLENTSLFFVEGWR